MAKLAVFGAAGLTGELVVQRALAQGEEVLALERNPGRVTLEYPNLLVLEGNPRSLADLDGCVSVAVALIHCQAPRIGYSRRIKNLSIIRACELLCRQQTVPRSLVT